MNEEIKLPDNWYIYCDEYNIVMFRQNENIINQKVNVGDCIVKCNGSSVIVFTPKEPNIKRSFFGVKEIEEISNEQFQQFIILELRKELQYHRIINENHERELIRLKKTT